jgi:hypothetical protein
MDPKTGRIEVITTEEDERDAKKRGLVPIPPDEVARVSAMNRHDRRAWVAQQRRTWRRQGFRVVTP